MFENLNDPRRTQWRNSEDELLKAFVMKYGTNSWSRISCTLRYKTPNQCRDRWNEYIFPSLHKKNWTEDDDAQLVKLSKTFPNQWKTIAASLGRTAQHCITRFEELLGQGDENFSSGGTDVALDSLVQHGVVYPHTQPAIADSRTLSHDEIVALQEGSARIANIQNRKERKQNKKLKQENTASMKKLRKLRDLQRAGLLPRGSISQKTIASLSMQEDMQSKVGENEDEEEIQQIDHEMPKSSLSANSCPSEIAHPHSEPHNYTLTFEDCVRAQSVFPDVEETEWAECSRS